MRKYLSLLLLFVPAVLFGILLYVFRENPLLHIESRFPYLPWQLLVLVFFGIIATVGGVLDWRFHRKVLGMKMSKKERRAEALALGAGGIPMFAFMWLAMLSAKPIIYLIPIILILIFTTVAISYDEFIFHANRCGKEETFYHRILVFGNGIAWLAWVHFIYY